MGNASFVYAMFKAILFSSSLPSKFHLDKANAIPLQFIATVDERLAQNGDIL
jgi:hypothetical protein